MPVPVPEPVPRAARGVFLRLPARGILRLGQQQHQPVVVVLVVVAVVVVVVVAEAVLAVAVARQEARPERREALRPGLVAHGRHCGPRASRCPLLACLVGVVRLPRRAAPQLARAVDRPPLLPLPPLPPLLPLLPPRPLPPPHRPHRRRRRPRRGGSSVRSCRGGGRRGRPWRMRSGVQRRRPWWTTSRS